MTTKQGRSRLGCALSAAVMAAVAPQWAYAQGQSQVPPYMNIIVGSPPPAETAKQDMLALNTAMFGLYGDASIRSSFRCSPAPAVALSCIGPDRNRSTRLPFR